MHNPWKGSDKLEELIALTAIQDKISLSGLSRSAFISLSAALIDSLGRRGVFIIEKEQDEGAVSQAYSSFSDKSSRAFPMDFPSRQIDTLNALCEGSCDMIIATRNSLMSRVPSPEIFRKAHMYVRPGDSSYSEILSELKRGNYLRSDTLFEPGEYARRGRVIDYWPPGEKRPIRVAFDGETVSGISFFNSSTQRSEEKIDRSPVYPAEFSREVNGHVSDYLGGDMVVIVNQDVDIETTKIPPHSLILINGGLQGSDIIFSTRTLKYSSSYPEVKKSMEALKRSGYRFFISAPSQIEKEKLQELLLEDSGISAEGFVSDLNEGFLSEELKVALYTPGEILPYRKSRVKPPPPNSHPVDEFSDISQGDYLVHWKFGLGEYLGIEKKTHGVVESDFIKIKYLNDAVVYVAVENAGLLHKYAGRSQSVKLDSLSGKAWQKRKEKVRESVRELATRLLRLYGREKRKGISFPTNPGPEEEFASVFPYRLTPHQKTSVEEVLSDMESSESMDRLICGDVGFGKTEVLMRAAFRAVINGYQVAILAPTTLLARQHFNSFRERFAEFPVIIDMLSRLLSPSEKNRVLEKLSEGITDIIIGTHGLLSEKIEFPRIGLLIIDEEQRFGVEHKEALRFRYSEADLLTATATPIPRTLAMAMGNVKGFSLINTPPPGRQGVKTEVLPFSMQRVREAVVYEINRGGQVYYVHSRVATIRETLRRLKENIPEASFGYIHGRMKADKIESVMDDFINGKFNCLISTTIIENGIDLPGVNTMIIDSTDRLGLADIYQLRGRVGRSDIRAYCYLMYPEHIELSENMRERLEALNSFSALGGGFQLALRDLQIRGAGELLGPKQHGNIMSVGFELYSEILKEELAELRGEKYSSPTDTEISLPVSALIPEDYIESSHLRLALYRRLSSLRSIEKIDEILVEINDRFGPIPFKLMNLLEIVRLRIISAETGINSVIWKKDKLIIKYLTEEKLLIPSVDKKSALSLSLEHINQMRRLKELKQR